MRAQGPTFRGAISASGGEEIEAKDRETGAGTESTARREDCRPEPQRRISSVVRYARGELVDFDVGVGMGLRETLSRLICRLTT